MKLNNLKNNIVRKNVKIILSHYIIINTIFIVLLAILN